MRHLLRSLPQRIIQHKSYSSLQPPRMASKPEDSSSDKPSSSACLEPLKPSEFSIYNGMAEHMDYFHNHFRQQWTTLYNACSTSTRPARTTLRQFLSSGLTFCSQLTMHHGIEEAHVFPYLARRMPAFRKELELLEQHKKIHKGLDRFEEYLRECRDGERDFQFVEMKARMDAFGPVLWQHLDEEVKQLGANEMRKYWTLKEMREFPFL